ncbi:DUF5719 family protein [Sinomonas humi]|uniref:Large extracellular alpha-helical protein n=1 Tax=Sinomonas humi TaxID=1338436 RepID=A0A0B2AG82_9MICC|nr:DUF5719 family protein [Sinomonas humi]KHL02254.1 hypothetical protein LK10_13365 [Sinomonas humi]
MTRESKASNQTKRRLRRALGVAAGVVVLGAGTGLVVAANAVPAPAALRPGTAPSVDVPVGQTVGVCPGPAELLQGTPVQGDPQFSPASTTASSLLTAAVLGEPSGALPASSINGVDGSVLQKVSDPQKASATPPSSAPAVVASRATTGPALLTASALEDRPSSAAALFRYTATDGDLRGLAAGPCASPSNDLWLGGASTTVGRTSVLYLTNPTTTPASVDLDFYGDQPLGQVPAGSRGIQVPPGTTKSFVLGGFEPGQRNLSVHVRSSGGPVAAVIQQSTLRGLTPGGVDFLTPVGAPSTRAVATGVELQDPAASSALASQDGFDDATAALQVTVPGAANAIVQIRVFGQNGPVTLPSGAVFTAKAGSVTEIPLAGLPAGKYSISAASDVSFTASVRMVKGTSPAQPLDFAVSGAQPRLGDGHVVPVGEVGQRTLVFAVPDGRARITATPISDDGKLHAPVTLDVAGGTTATLQVPDTVDGAKTAAYSVSSSGDPAYGSLLLEADQGNGISVASILPPAGGRESIPVTLGY